MSEEEENNVSQPKKKSGNKVARWFKTWTGQTVIGVLAGAVALKVPGGQEVVQAVLGSNAPSDPGSFANGMSIAAILAGIARARSA
jgi:hypothetical protein